jgi:hypothetical protein
MRDGRIKVLMDAILKHGPVAKTYVWQLWPNVNNLTFDFLLLIHVGAPISAVRPM